MALVSSNAVSSEAVGHKEYVGRFVAITNDIADGPAIAEQTVSQNALSGIPDRYSATKRTQGAMRGVQWLRCEGIAQTTARSGM